MERLVQLAEIPEEKKGAILGNFTANSVDQSLFLQIPSFGDSRTFLSALGVNNLVDQLKLHNCMSWSKELQVYFYEWSSMVSFCISFTPLNCSKLDIAKSPLQKCQRELQTWFKAMNAAQNFYIPP